MDIIEKVKFTLLLVQDWIYKNMFVAHWWLLLLIKVHYAKFVSKIS